MTTLEEFNALEWAEVEKRVRLIGGRANGWEFHLRDLPERWFIPRHEFDITKEVHRLDWYAVRTADHLVYIRTGNVTDDGAHIYKIGKS